MRAAAVLASLLPAAGPLAAPAPPWRVQLVPWIAGLVLKPLHMTLTLVLLWALRRGAGSGLRLLRRGLLAFLVGEAACAAAYLAGGAAGVALDAVHDLGMVLLGALGAWGAAELLEERVLRVTAPGARCAFTGLCQRCARGDPARCLAARLLRIGCAVLGGLALLPLCGGLVEQARVVCVFGTDVPYAYPLARQVAHFRALPAAALACFALAFIQLGGRTATLRRAEPAFFAGLGLLAFSSFRFFLLGAFRAAPWWADFWEEATELATVATIGHALWTLRVQLGLAARPGTQAR